MFYLKIILAFSTQAYLINTSKRWPCDYQNYE